MEEDVDVADVDVAVTVVVAVELARMTDQLSEGMLDGVPVADVLRPKQLRLDISMFIYTLVQGTNWEQ